MKRAWSRCLSSLFWPCLQSLMFSNKDRFFDARCSQTDANWPNALLRYKPIPLALTTYVLWFCQLAIPSVMRNSVLMYRGFEFSIDWRTTDDLCGNRGIYAHESVAEPFWTLVMVSSTFLNWEWPHPNCFCIEDNLVERWRSCLAINHFLTSQCMLINSAFKSMPSFNPNEQLKAGGMFFPGIIFPTSSNPSCQDFRALWPHYLLSSPLSQRVYKHISCPLILVDTAPDRTKSNFKNNGRQH